MCMHLYVFTVLLHDILRGAASNLVHSEIYLVAFLTAVHLGGLSVEAVLACSSTAAVLTGSVSLDVTSGG